MPRIGSNEVGRRSGRFDNQPSGASPLKITSEEHPAQHYRVYNTAEDDITVNPGGHIIGKRSSLDLKVPEDALFEISGAVLQGIYDRIDIVRSQVRSGRFQYAAAQTIISSVSGPYRFFNTRRIGASRVTVDGTNYNIRQGCTLDISVTGSTVEARGIGVYDRLGMETAVRSGHFKTDATIDVAVLSTDSIYRFFNAGENVYAVKVKGATKNLAMVSPFSSMDVQLPAGTTEIVPSTGVVCEGAYDFIQ